jgi:hypothetical protein
MDRYALSERLRIDVTFGQAACPLMRERAGELASVDSTFEWR